MATKTKTPTKKPSVTFTLKDGTVITYDRPFKLTKTHLAKFRLVRDGCGEGPWFWLHPDDVADYKANSASDRVRLGVVANDCLAGLPWGCVFPYVMQGEDRPECNMDTLMDLKGKPDPYKPLFEHEARQLIKAGKCSAETRKQMIYILGDKHPLVLKLKALKARKPKKSADEVA